MVLLSNGLSFLHNRAGVRNRILYFTQSLGSVWDDAVTQTISGTALWLDALIMSVSPRNSEDAILLEQGKIAEQDKKIFINGSVLIQTGSTSARIQIGSPTGINYQIVPLGTDSANWGNTDVFKKVYLRALPNGSLIGET